LTKTLPSKIPVLTSP